MQSNVNTNEIVIKSTIVYPVNGVSTDKQSVGIKALKNTMAAVH